MWKNSVRGPAIPQGHECMVMLKLLASAELMRILYNLRIDMHMLHLHLKNIFYGPTLPASRILATNQFELASDIFKGFRPVLAELASNVAHAMVSVE